MSVDFLVHPFRGVEIFKGAALFHFTGSRNAEAACGTMRVQQPESILPRGNRPGAVDGNPHPGIRRNDFPGPDVLL